VRNLRQITAISVAVALVLGGGIALAQTPNPNTAGSVLSPADTYFASQTSLGTPYQVDSGRLARTKGTTAAIRPYADLMVSSHILKPKAPLPLMQAAYATMIWTLQHDVGKTFDDDYVTGQINYQKANAALYRFELANGSDPDLKAFAQQTPPKSLDHLDRAAKLNSEAE
jgi:putative membrane protein